MKKVIMVLCLVLVFSMVGGSVASAAITCTSWIDTGVYSTKKCVDEWCGLNPFLNIMKGTREQKRVCQGYDANGDYVQYSEPRNVTDLGSCC